MQLKNISKIYFSVSRDEKYKEICFEDLTVQEQLMVLENKDKEYLIELALEMARNLKMIITLSNIKDEINENKNRKNN